MRILTPFSISLVAYEWRRVCGVTRRWIPAALAAAAKVSDSTRLLIGASPRRLGNSHRRLRWVHQVAEFVEDLPRPLHAWVAGSNVGSIRVLEKCGFVAVGSRTEHDENFGPPVEEILYELA